MIKEAIRKFYEDYYLSVDFRAWQNDFANSIYEKLKPLVSPGQLNEVPKITALCDVISGRRYRGLSVESKMIHGYNNSGVEFDCAGKKSNKELADMVIISIVTIDGRIVLHKTAFIQNKDSKDTPDKWKIDKEQLFLLKNFPTFMGERGIFKGQTMTFHNHSNTLGNYGLFSSDGEMSFLTAKNTYYNQQSNGYIGFEDIKKGATMYMSRMTAPALCNRCKRFCGCDPLDCNYCGSFEYALGGAGNLPFFSNYGYALDVHEVVRELTYFNIGEVSSTHKRELNGNLYGYTNALLKLTFGYSIEEGYFNRDNRQNPDDFGELVRMVMQPKNVTINHLELNYKRN